MNNLKNSKNTIVKIGKVSEKTLGYVGPYWECPARELKYKPR